MFEKSLYDLIRGMRNHKGNEKEYIQASIQECRKEIKGQDMDVKATAVLKLTYLEMFGHDMSWAAFNVLEVMSSAKFPQKRLGYLGAIQSYRPDTEVLLLAENLLKKDLTSPQLPTISLPLIAIPHVISPSMANSLLSDLLPRLSHSSPSIRKKAIATLYRQALLYPEILRVAWPKIKERLLDENEDPSVTAAVVNVVCELGWRRPQEFLPLAPRLFELLVDGSNNWMAIKIIKLFATLIPLEPRLVKKLQAPLTTLIRSTPAMSLLYECINGIIQGGMLESAQQTTEGDELARLCLGKLSEMLTIEGDPNLKYVALLAFHRIVQVHPYLVTMYENVILDCIEDPDISIRLRALDLVIGMVTPNSLDSIVERLLQQLDESPQTSAADDIRNDRGNMSGVDPYADSDDSDAEQDIRRTRKPQAGATALPTDYLLSVIQRILDMCGQDMYSNVNDFDWYVGVLVRLVRHVPSDVSLSNSTGFGDGVTSDSEKACSSVAFAIGTELRNVAVRVKSSRAEVVRNAEKLISIDQRPHLFPPSGTGANGVLAPVVWLVGEYSKSLLNRQATLDSLMHTSTYTLPSDTISAYLQAILKIFVTVTGDRNQAWTPERKTSASLLAARVDHFLQPLTASPHLEVQERAVEFLELIKLAAEAIASHNASFDYSTVLDPPMLLTDAIPSLFDGPELNPVSKDAQRKVPIPEDLKLDDLINEDLNYLLQTGLSEDYEDANNELNDYYYVRQQTQPSVIPAADRLKAMDDEASYQQSYNDYNDHEAVALRKAQRREKNRDDPFYIADSHRSASSTSLDRVIRSENGETLDIDSIPVMELSLDDAEVSARPKATKKSRTALGKKVQRRTFEILADENIDDDEASLQAGTAGKKGASKNKKSLLQVNSAGLSSLSLGAQTDGRETQFDIERRETEEREMARALAEIERRRLEMQREAERIQIGDESTVLNPSKPKKKKKTRVTAEEQETNINPENNGLGKAKRKKKKPASDEPVATDQLSQAPQASVDGVMPTVTKKKVRRRQHNFATE